MQFASCLSHSLHIYIHPNRKRKPYTVARAAVKVYEKERARIYGLYSYFRMTVALRLAHRFAHSHMCLLRTYIRVCIYIRTREEAREREPSLLCMRRERAHWPRSVIRLHTAAIRGEARTHTPRMSLALSRRIKTAAARELPFGENRFFGARTAATNESESGPLCHI